MKSRLNSMKSSRILKACCVVLGIIVFTLMKSPLYFHDALFAGMFVYYAIKWFTLEP